MLTDLSKLPFPFPLPEFEAAWLNANDQVAFKLAYAAHKEKAFDRLPILADALEEAGCADAFLLAHLREKHNPILGCWRGSCWLLNHLLDRPQEVLCRFSWPQPESECDATVINSGDGVGCGPHLFMIWCDDCMEPPIYVVEADDFSEAEDIFIDSDYGQAQIITPDSPEAIDFGWYDKDRESWVNLRGEAVKGPLREPQCSGGGSDYDGEHICCSAHLFDPYYYAPGLPLCGVRPKRFRPTDCDNCKREYFVSRDWTNGDFCSDRCRVHWTYSGSPNMATFVVSCPVCGRCVDPVHYLGGPEDADAGAKQLVRPHFDHIAGGDYAMPADDADEVYYDDFKKKEYKVCPGTGQLVRATWKLTRNS